MSQSEAWIITALGMTVVYIGLLLCVAFIQLFSRLAARISWGDGPHGAPAAASAPASGSPALPAEPIPADILAVIATAIEVERKLYVSRPDARRPALQS
jgi:Na+-transporting methylmalonyl-CoA/oxaloacetate decarboxylase gamma subunit